MKLAKLTKKGETRATLNTFKITSLFKREMKIQNGKLSKIRDHRSTNRRMKLRENRRNIKHFPDKHKVVSTFIHTGNEKGMSEILQAI
jgi:hypothetical protein